MWHDANRAFPARFSSQTRGTPLLSLHLSSTSLDLYRTFLSWLHFTVVLGGLAVGLLNFGDSVRFSAPIPFAFPYHETCLRCRSVK